jgi:hypothetical protein
MSTTTLPTFSEVLTRFNKLVEDAPPVPRIKKQLDELRAIASSRGEFTVRQSEAILSRINHYEAGTYGNTKKEEHYGHVKAEKK